MLTNGFYRTLASALQGRTDQRSFFIAVGTGEEGWDERTPRESRDVTGLVAEVGRKAVLSDEVVLLDSDGQPAEEPATRLQLSVTFSGDEAVGTLREAGLFEGEASEELDAGTLLSYFTHARIDKTEQMTLSRTFRIDLTPQAIAPGSRVTRYLANTGSGEFHDLENTVPNCQIDEIRFDRRFYFPGVADATSGGYDFCAYCFGREVSDR